MKGPSQYLRPSVVVVVWILEEAVRRVEEEKLRYFTDGLLPLQFAMELALKELKIKSPSFVLKREFISESDVRSEDWAEITTFFLSDPTGRSGRGVLLWGKRWRGITSVPKFPRLNKVRTAKQMRGRPITAAEFERMLAAVDSVWPDLRHDRNNANQRREQQRESIRFLLYGLWFSGLRLGEALGLTWDQ